MSLDNAKSIRYPNITFKQDYRIDKEGNIYTPWRGWHRMKTFVSTCGYEELMLYDTSNRRRHYKVHRLLMCTFKPIENEQELDVNHIDGNKLNNHIDNLEWCTRSENMIHAFKNGLQSNKGVHNPSSKLNEKQVHDICKKLLDKKESYSQIAKFYGVSKGTISNIANHRIWLEITKQYDL